MRRSGIAPLFIALAVSFVTGCGETRRPDFSNVKPAGSSAVKAEQVPQAIADLGFYYGSLSTSNPTRYSIEVANDGGCAMAASYRATLRVLGSEKTFSVATGEFCSQQTNVRDGINPAALNCTQAQLLAGSILQHLTELETLCSSRRAGNETVARTLIDATLNYRNLLGITTVPANATAPRQ